MEPIDADDVPADVEMGLCPACGVSIPRVWEDSVVCEGGGHHTVPLRPVPPPPVVPAAPGPSRAELEREWRGALWVFVVLAAAVIVGLYWVGRS